MTTATLTLTEFLLARIAEDEAGVEDSAGWYEHRYALPRARVLAECEAKRRIVEEFLETQHTIGGLEEEGDYEAAMGWANDLSALATALRHLAAVYADHPDYRDEWA